MRRLVCIIVALALLAGCGTEAAINTPTTTSPTDATTVETSVGTTVDTSGVTTTAAPPELTTTTSPGEEPPWTVAAYGHDISVVLNDAGALGSGCSPGNGVLPDGIWFGWVTEFNADSVEFDLACLWPGRAQPAASNDTAGLRTVPVAAEAPLYTLTGNPVPYSEWDGQQATFVNAPGLPESPPVWLFINDGSATELLEHSVPIDWALRSTAWPAWTPGCCAYGDVAPPSPDDPWPSEGWPADGFYSVLAEDVSSSAIATSIRRLYDCDDRPELCSDWWEGDEVSTDPLEAPLLRSLEFNRDLTVVILPLDAEVPLVGDGTALGRLLTEAHEAIAEWLGHGDIEDLAADPEFPFGNPSVAEGSQFPIGFRGPGGTYLTYHSDPLYLFGRTVLEIRNDAPILYIHAGLVAG